MIHKQEQVPTPPAAHRRQHAGARKIGGCHDARGRAGPRRRRARCGSVATASAAPRGGEEHILVRGEAPHASTAQFHTSTAQLGPLGQTPILTAPVSVTVLTQDFS